MGAKLTFDADTHTYHLDGAHLPSVTQVLDQIVNLSGIPRGTLERKRQIGTAVHLATALDDLNDLDESSIDPDVVLPYVLAWRKFRADTGFVPSAIERTVFSGYGYAGTLDRIGQFNGRTILLDIKTTVTASPVTGPQTAAYARAWFEMEKTNLTNDRYSVQLRKNGTYLLVPHTDADDFTTFLSCLNLYQWRKKHGV